MTTNLLPEIAAHIDDMSSLMDRIDPEQENERHVCLQYSMITCLTIIAQLHDVIATQGNESRRLCREALNDIVALTGKLRKKDYCLLDPFVGVS